MGTSENVDIGIRSRVSQIWLSANQMARFLQLANHFCLLRDSFSCSTPPIQVSLWRVSHLRMTYTYVLPPSKKDFCQPTSNFPKSCILVGRARQKLFMRVFLASIPRKDSEKSMFSERGLQQNIHFRKSDRLLHNSQKSVNSTLTDPIQIKMSLADIVPPGVVTGDNLVKLLEHARDNGYAIPAVNCTRCVRQLTARFRVENHVEFANFSRFFETARSLPKLLK